MFTTELYRTRAFAALSVALATQLVTAPSANAQSFAAERGTAPRPFAAGESLHYEATFGGIRVGEGSLQVVGVETVRGRPAWRLAFRLTGGVPLYRIDDRLESWVDTTTLASLRFTRQLSEGRRKRSQRFEIMPERGVYEEEGRAPQPTVAHPLDDGAFFYFVRTLPLRVGDRYTLDRYFRPDRNPVQVSVVRRERIRVPAGTFDAVVLRPVINTPGVLSQARRTELWVTDDDARVLVQVQSHLPFGSITMKLTSMTRGTGGPRAARRAAED